MLLSLDTENSPASDKIVQACRITLMKVEKRVEMNIIRFPERFMRANSYLIQISDNYTLIDPSLAPAALDQELGEGEHKKVERLVVTHPHYDHIVYLDHWQEKLNLPVYIHEASPEILQDPSLNASTLFGRSVSFRSQARFVREGAKVPIGGGYYLTAIYLPGHTLADICLTLRHTDQPDPLAIFAGDIVFADSIGRTDIEGGDERLQRANLQRLARLLMIWPGDTKIYAGHGRETTVREVLDENVFMMAAAGQVRQTSTLPRLGPAGGEEGRFVWPERKPALIAYVGTDHLREVKVPDALDIDIVNIAFGRVEDSAVRWKPSAEAVEAMDRLRTVHPDIRLVLSIGGWGAGGFSEMAAEESGRLRFAESCKKVVTDYKLDGVDLDWEYPGIGAAGIASSPDDKQTFTLMLKEVRKALDTIPGTYKQLSIAAGASDRYIEHTEMDKVAEILDYVQVMTYDLSTAYGRLSAHHTNLYPSRLYRERMKVRPLAERFEKRFGDRAEAMLERFLNTSVDSSVKAFVAAGVPVHKIVIGAAFYGRSFPAVNAEGDGLVMESREDAHAGPDYNQLTDQYLEENGFQSYWDESAQAAWLFNGERFITYDDPRSLRSKADYIKENGIPAVMYWVYETANQRGLNRVLREALDRE